jgi:hypothetical protein
MFAGQALRILRQWREGALTRIKVGRHAGAIIGAMLSLITHTSEPLEAGRAAQNDYPEAR